ncbi:MAG: pgl [Solirubrobacterales bacterium]|jgi:6-phosphogluconolactonase|nr:pgl [Solirubrobacterales bacterium]
MTGPLLTVTHDEEEAAERVAEVLATAIESARTVRGVAHLALSGGSTPKLAHRKLGPRVGDWEGVHVWFADERCVGPDDPESNARLVRETLDAPGAIVHRIPGELGPEAAAAAYAEELDDVVLDAVLLGMGPDGHTASLFPGHPALHADGAVVAIRDAPKPPPERVSLTLRTLNAAHRLVLLVTGEGKADALARVVAGPDPEIPASLLERERLEIVADEAALARVSGDG